MPSLSQSLSPGIKMHPKSNHRYFKTKLSSAGKQALFGVTSFFLLFLTSALPALAASPQATSTTQPPRASDLDIPFVPEDNGLNKLLGSLDDHGVKPILQFYGDFLANPVGGLRQSAAWFQYLVYGVHLDLEQLIGWKGGEFTLTAVDTGGDDIGDQVGTSFTPAQAVIFRGSALFKILLTQHLFDDRLQLTIGRTSAGSLYARLPMSGLTVTGAANGNPLSLFYNASGFRMGGRANWMANIKARPSKDTYVQSGIFQVSTDRMDKYWYNGTDFSFRRGDGTILLTEAGWTPTFAKEEEVTSTGKEAIHSTPFAGLPGIYMVGGYWQNYPMQTFLGNDSLQNEYGFYAEAQQMVWRSHMNPDHNFTIWGGITYSPQQQIARLPVMAFGGVNWSGLIPGRDKDQLLLDGFIGGYSRDYSRNYLNQGKGSRTVEAVLEASYIIQLTRQIQFQPDLQWILQPDGAQKVPNALLLGFQVSFGY